MHLVHAPLPASDPTLPTIAIPAERLTLAKRRWRGRAEDGTEFGFELETPLKHGDSVFRGEAGTYVIRQEPEAVIEVSLDIAPSAAAGIGWAIGNLHLELSAENTRLLTGDTTAIRQLLDRLKVPYRSTSAIFRPGRFARGEQQTHDLGPSHRH